MYRPRCNQLRWWFHFFPRHSIGPGLRHITDRNDQIILCPFKSTGEARTLRTRTGQCNVVWTNGEALTLDRQGSYRLKTGTIIVDIMLVYPLDKKASDKTRVRPRGENGNNYMTTMPMFGQVVLVTNMHKQCICFSTNHKPLDSHITGADLRSCSKQERGWLKPVSGTAGRPPVLATTYSVRPEVGVPHHPLKSRKGAARRLRKHKASRELQQICLVSNIHRHVSTNSRSD